jgi:hypothetical protein
MEIRRWTALVLTGVVGVVAIGVMLTVRPAATADDKDRAVEQVTAQLSDPQLIERTLLLLPDVEKVTIARQKHSLAGVNTYRCRECLVQYTRAVGVTTGTNKYGTEVAVVDGKVIEIVNGVGDMPVPRGRGNYVLSGHGEAGLWLRNVAVIGAEVHEMRGRA